jgi:hypothetical protein
MLLNIRQLMVGRGLTADPIYAEKSTTDIMGCVYNESNALRLTRYFIYGLQVEET